MANREPLKKTGNKKVWNQGLKDKAVNFIQQTRQRKGLIFT